MSEVKSDIQIAREAQMEPIKDILAKINVPDESSAFSPMGRHIAKINLEYLNTLKKKDGNLILVTAITPTPAGEGKTTTSVGLNDGLNKIGKQATVVLREPSLGPVFGIKGGAAGGGLVIDKKIVTGPHGITGEWGHNQLPIIEKKTTIKKNNLREGEIESSISGLSLSKKFKSEFNKDLKAHEIFELYRKHELNAEKIIEDFKDNLSMAIASVVNILDPDVFIFGGGLSNEIDFFNEIQSKVRKFVAGNEFEGIFLKPKFGDASGVRGAARLGRNINY